MKKALFLLTLIGYFSVQLSLAQSKRELKQEINLMKEKIETLTAKIDLLTEKNKAIEKELQGVKLQVESLKQEILVNNTTPSVVPASGHAPVVEPEKQQPQRCKAITQSGKQCSRNAQQGSDYCWQHQKKADSINGQSETDKSSNTSGNREIYTGPRGGKYYINSKGNKVYIKKKS